VALTSAGVPSFVGEWLLDKIVPGTVLLTSDELAKVNSFVQKAFLGRMIKKKLFLT
jgi:ATP-dependent Lon protease